MEGVGARLGRSSARYAPTTVFSGPVRRWKKNWVPLSNPNNSNTNSNHSHLLLYKWTPITPLSNGTAAATPPASGKDAAVAATPPSAAEETPRRKFRYIPIRVSVLEQKLEVNLKSDDENKPDDVDTSLQPAQFNDSDGKADEGDVLMDEVQASERERAQTEEARETNLDLRLGLKAHDEVQEDDLKISMSSSRDGTSMKPSESETRKRKTSATNLEMRE